MQYITPSFNPPQSTHLLCGPLAKVWLYTTSCTTRQPWPCSDCTISRNSRILFLFRIWRQQKHIQYDRCTLYDLACTRTHAHTYTHRCRNSGCVTIPPQSALRLVWPAMSAPPHTHTYTPPHSPGPTRTWPQPRRHTHLPTAPASHAPGHAVGVSGVGALRHAVVHLRHKWGWIPIIQYAKATRWGSTHQLINQFMYYYNSRRVFVDKGVAADQSWRVGGGSERAAGEQVVLGVRVACCCCTLTTLTRLPNRFRTNSNAPKSPNVSHM